MKCSIITLRDTHREANQIIMAKSSRPAKNRGNNSAVILPLFPQVNVEPAQKEDEADAELLTRIAQGDNTAFALLVRRHTLRFYRVAYRFLRSRSNAEDIVQDAFLKLWEKPSLWQADRNTAFTTWFYRIVVNLCLDHAKKKRPLQLIDDTWMPDERETQEEEMLMSEKQQLLEAHIAILPERQRTALNLCFYEGLSNQEAAQAMGLHLKALQALLMRAKTTLKERLSYMTGGRP